MSFLDDLEDEPQVVVPEVVASKPPRTAEQRQLDAIKKREDAIYERGLEVVEGYYSSPDIEGNEDEPPAEWVAEVGERKAKKRLRIAKHALLNKKDAPVYLELTKATVTGIQKARESRPVSIGSLNATFLLAAPPTAQGVMAALGAPVALAAPGPAQEYPVIDVEPEDEGEK